jgi:hypothetical protein
MMDNLGWSESMYQSVDWIQTGRAMRTYDYNDQVRIRKIRHKWLPTNKMRNRWAEHIPNECPLCKRNEPQEHIYRCQHPTRRKIVNEELINVISKLRKNGTNSQLCDIISKAIIAWVQTGKTTYDIPMCLSANITQTIASQNLIGWDNFMSGFISKKWKPLIAATTEKTDTRNPAEQWYNSTFKIVNDFSIKIWIQRNNDMHNDVEEKKWTKELQELFAEIENLYGRAKTLPQKYQHFTTKKLDDWKGSNAPAMNAWIIQARPIIKKVEVERRMQQTHRQGIRKYIPAHQRSE